MEIRKIQVTGGASFIVSLPKNWAKEYNISKNDKVGIVVRTDGSLLITPKITGEHIEKTKEFDVTEIEKASPLFRMLLGAYIGGYNTITVKSKNRISPSVRETVRKFIRAAIGLEIIEETSTSLTIKDLLNPGEMPFDKAISRITSLVKNMHEDAILALNNSDKDLAEDVITRDNEVDRLNWLISRQYNIVSRNVLLAEKIGVDTGKIANYSLISRIIERIGDHAVRIAENSLTLVDEKVDEEIIKSIVSASKIALETFTKSIDTWVKRDIQTANENIESIPKLLSKCEKIINRELDVKGASSLEISYIAESIRRTGEYAGDISELVINQLISE